MATPKSVPKKVQKTIVRMVKKALQPNEIGSVRIERHFAGFTKLPGFIEIHIDCLSVALNWPGIDALRTALGSNTGSISFIKKQGMYITFNNIDFNTLQLEINDAHQEDRKGKKASRKEASQEEGL